MSSSQIVLRERSIIRRQPLLQSQSRSQSFSSFSSSSAPIPTCPSTSSSSSSSCGFAEVAGGTTAECAAVCCCCPCGLANLLVLVIYKVPAGLCRAAWRRKRRKRLMKKGLLPPHRRRCQCGCDETELQIHTIDRPNLGFEEYSTAVITPLDQSEDVFSQLEKEMLERFYGTGFWRSPSQRESIIINTATTTATTATAVTI